MGKWCKRFISNRSHDDDNYVTVHAEYDKRTKNVVSNA